MIGNPVRRTCAAVAAAARHVSIDDAAIEEFAIKTGPIRPDEIWEVPMHLQTDEEKTLLTYLVALDALNFCFWNDTAPRWNISWRGKSHTGYYALSLALRAFFENYPEKANFRYLAEISQPEFAKILQGGEGLLLLKTRHRIIREVSRAIMRRYAGDPRIMVKKSGGQVSALARIAASLPSFDDQAVYKGRRVFFYKRAQILAGDIYGSSQKFRTMLRDADYLTAFADYKIPQILFDYGILRYAPGLERAIRTGARLGAGTERELELRAATVIAVERITEALRQRGTRIIPCQTDWLLWNESKKRELSIPHHNTLTIYY